MVGPIRGSMPFEPTDNEGDRSTLYTRYRWVKAHSCNRIQPVFFSFTSLSSKLTTPCRLSRPNTPAMYTYYRSFRPPLFTLATLGRLDIGGLFLVETSYTGNFWLWRPWSWKQSQGDRSKFRSKSDAQILRLPIVSSRVELSHVAHCVDLSSDFVSGMFSRHVCVKKWRN